MAAPFDMSLGRGKEKEKEEIRKCAKRFRAFSSRNQPDGRSGISLNRVSGLAFTRYHAITFIFSPYLIFFLDFVLFSGGQLLIGDYKQTDDTDDDRGMKNEITVGSHQTQLFTTPPQKMK